MTQAQVATRLPATPVEVPPRCILGLWGNVGRSDLLAGVIWKVLRAMAHELLGVQAKEVTMRRIPLSGLVVLLVTLVRLAVVVRRAARASSSSGIA